MQTGEPGWGPTPNADARRDNRGRMTSSDDSTQPMTPTRGPAQTPPMPPGAAAGAAASATPLGAALGMAFVFGLACALYWSFVSNAVTQLELFLMTNANSSAIQLIADTLIIVLALAIPVAVLSVAWRRRGARSAGGFVIALVGLLVVALGPGALLYALALAAPVAPVAAQLASAIEPGVPLQIFVASPVIALLILSVSTLTISYTAVNVWGGARISARSRGAARALALARWEIVGLSASLGAMVYSVVRLSILDYFYTRLEELAFPQMLLRIFQQLQAPQLLVFTVIGALIGGALIRGAASSPTAEQADSARRPLGGGRLIGLGALMVALGLASSLWLPGVLIISYDAVTGPPDIAFLGVAALVPTLILIFALLAVFRRLGARAGWGVLSLAALSYAPLLFELLALGLAHRLGTNDMFALLLSGAPVALVFGVGVTLAAVFGAARAERWRLRAATIGALVGVGYALTYAVLAVSVLATPPGPCGGFGGCVLESAFRIGIPTTLIAYGAEGLGFALVGATVGGWLRASAPPARFVDIAG